MKTLDAFTHQYLVTALWAECDDSGEAFDRKFGLENISAESLENAISDCSKFQALAGDLLSGVDMETAGHDFWLTRNHHGAGFWDGDYPEIIGEKLTELSHQFKEAWIYLSDAGELEIA